MFSQLACKSISMFFDPEKRFFSIFKLKSSICWDRILAASVKSNETMSFLLHQFRKRLKKRKITKYCFIIIYVDKCFF